MFWPLRTHENILETDLVNVCRNMHADEGILSRPASDAEAPTEVARAPKVRANWGIWGENAYGTLFSDFSPKYCTWDAFDSRVLYTCVHSTRKVSSVEKFLNNDWIDLFKGITILRPRKYRMQLFRTISTHKSFTCSRSEEKPTIPLQNSSIITKICFGSHSFWLLLERNFWKRKLKKRWWYASYFCKKYSLYSSHITRWRMLESDIGICELGIIQN